MKFLKLLISTCLLVNFLDAKVVSNEEKKVIEMGMAASSLLRSTLMGKMKKELKKKDKEALLKFCSTQAKDITKDVNNLLPLGVSVQRISFKNRSDTNFPHELHINPIETLKEKSKGTKNPESIHTLLKFKDDYIFYRPIVIKKRCLNCHGDKETMDRSIVKQIETYYPKDKAFGYEEGDFRGVFVVDILKKAYK